MPTKKTIAEFILLQRKIANNVLKYAGMTVSKDYYILDEDSYLPWKFKDKYVLYKPDERLIAVHFDQIIFDPLNKLMMKDLLDIAIAKFIQYEEIYVKMAYVEVDTRNKKKAHIITENDRISSEYYDHEIIAFYDMIVRIGPDLKETKALFIDDLYKMDAILNDYLPKGKKIRKRGFFDDIHG